MNIGIVTNGRIASSRLPKKMVLPIGGQTFLEAVIDLIQKTAPDFSLVYTTTTADEDTQLANLAAAKGIPVNRGHLTDMLSQYQQVMHTHNFDAILTWDGDDLFLDRRCLDLTAEHLRAGADYVMPKELPYGTFCYGMSRKAVDKIMEVKADDDTQGSTRYFTQIPGFTLKEYALPQYQSLAWIRLTLDYPEDYELITKLHDYWQAHPEITYALDAVKKFSEDQPEDCQINQNRVDEYQKRWKELYSDIKLKSNS